MTDPRVRQVDSPDDPFTWDVNGGERALTAIADLVHGARGVAQLTAQQVNDRVSTLVDTVARNPALMGYLAVKQFGPGFAADPHHYDAAYADGASLLAAASERR